MTPGDILTRVNKKKNYATKNVVDFSLSLIKIQWTDLLNNNSQEDDDENMEEREEDSMDDEFDTDENMTAAPIEGSPQLQNISGEEGVWPISPSAVELFNALRNINNNQMSDIIDFMEENLDEDIEEDDAESDDEDNEISEPSPKRPRLNEPESVGVPETQEELKNLPQVHFLDRKSVV